MNKDETESPPDLAPDEWPELARLAGKLVGEDAIRALFGFMVSPAGLAALSNPATFIHESSRRFGQVLDKRDDPSDNEIGSFVLDAFRALRDVTAKEIATPAFLACPGAKDLLVFLQRARERCGVEDAIACFRDSTASTLWSMGTLRGILSLLRVEAGSFEGPFEQRVRELARGIGDASERWYKPLLQVALRVERLVRGQPAAPVPSTLGTVMGQCRDLWCVDGPTAILDVDVRMIRNAHGHCEVEVDLEREEVRFVNRPGDHSPPQVLGPWREGDLQTFAKGFLARCWGMSIAYARFIVEETCKALDGNGWKLVTPEDPTKR